MLSPLIIKNTFHQVVARSISAIITFFISVVIARYFGSSQYGDFTKIIAFVGLFYLVVDFGLNAIYIKIDEHENRLSQFFTLRLMIAAVVVVGIAIITSVLPFNQTLGIGFSNTVKIGILVYSMSVFSQSIILTSSALFQKRLEYYKLTLATAAGSFATAIGIGASIYWQGSLFWVLFAMIIGSAITALFALYQTKSAVSPFFFDKNFSKSLLLQSLPLGAMLLCNLVYFRIDMIILSFYRTSYEVGIYGFSYRFFDFLITLPLFLSNAIYPSLVERHKNLRTILSIAKKYLLVFFLFSFLVLVPSWMLAPFFSLVKEEFAASITPFRILLVSLPFFFATNILQWIFITIQMQKFLLLVYILAAFLNIGLNLFFIPNYGYVASAIVTGVSEGFVLMLLLGKLFTLVKKYANNT